MGNWEVFRDKGRTALGHLPVVAVHKAGRFSMNQAAFDILGGPSHVELLFDESSSRMGLRASSREHQHAYSLKKPVGTSRYYITAVSFAHHYGIAPTKTYQQDATMEGDVLAIQVEATAPRVAPSSQDVSDPDEFDIDEFAATPARSSSPAVAAEEPHDIDPDDIPF